MADLGEIACAYQKSRENPWPLGRGCRRRCGLFLKIVLHFEKNVLCYFDQLSGGFLTDLPHHVKWKLVSSQS